MAEPVTDTAAWDGDGAGGDATEVVAEGLAWSADDSDDEPKHQPLWRRVLPSLLVVLAAAALVVSGSLLISRMSRPSAVSAAATATVEATPAAESSTPTTAPARTSWLGQIPSAAVQHVTDPDDLFLAALRNAGLVITDPARAVAGGHAVCSYLDEGHTKVETVRTMMGSNSTLTLMETARYLVAAVNVYCPQFGTAE